MANKKYIRSIPMRYLSHKFIDIQKQIAFLFQVKTKKDQKTADKLADLLQIQSDLFNKVIKYKNFKRL